MKTLFKHILLLIILSIAPFFIEPVSAQPPPPDPVDIPIDGGLFILLAAGMAYGAKKLHENKENDELAV